MRKKMLNVHVSLRQSSSQRAFIHFENMSPTLSVAEFKKEILRRAGIESDCILELVYSCRSIKDDSTLKVLEGNNPVKMIYANVVKPYSKQEAKKISASEQHQLFLSFRAAMTNPNFRQTLQNLSKVESLKLLLETIPGLAEDHIAQSMLCDWELLLHLADPKIVQVLVEKHPALVDAASRALSSVPGGTNVNQQRRSPQGWLARSLGADLDDDGMDEDAAPQQNAGPPSTAAGNGITPAQLAAALNFVQNNIRQPQPAMGQSLTPQSAPAAASRQPAPRPSSSNNGLTPEMFNQALMAALMNSVGGAGAVGGGGSSGSSGNSDSRREDTQLREQFDRFLPQMRELGITDDGLSLRALQATNGDVQAAVNLIFAGLVDD